MWDIEKMKKKRQKIRLKIYTIKGRKQRIKENRTNKVRMTREMRKAPKAKQKKRGS